MATLIVALDVATPSEVCRIVDRLGADVDFYKIGLELFTSAGPDVARALTSRGKRVFLDLKLHDIPRTVARAVSAGATLGVELMTVHGSGGRAMIEAAAEAAQAFPHPPKLLAVTVLTSLDQRDLSDLGVCRDLSEQVCALGRLACSSGADGIVCSPREVAVMRSALGSGALLVTPGVRPAGDNLGDQKRVATPRQAARDGATHLVVGRPILEASDPAEAARAILQEMTLA